MSFLRWAFGEAALLLIRESDQAKRFIDRLTQKHGKGKAISILSARIARCVYHMLRRRQAFDVNRFWGQPAPVTQETRVTDWKPVEKRAGRTEERSDDVPASGIPLEFPIAGAALRLIRPTGPKWAFSEAISLLKRECPPARAFAERIEQKHNKARANTLLAIKLGRAVYWMWKRKTAFDPRRMFHT